MVCNSCIRLKHIGDKIVFRINTTLTLFSPSCVYRISPLSSCFIYVNHVHPPPFICILYLIRLTVSPCDLLSCRFTETKLAQDAILTSQFHHEILIENMQVIYWAKSQRTDISKSCFISGHLRDKILDIKKQ